MAQRTLMIVLGFTMFAEGAAMSHSFLRLKENTCTCKNWKQVYHTGNVRCGEGREFTWAATNASSNASSPSLKYNEYSDDGVQAKECQQFWSVLDTGRCVNLNIGTDDGTWCYVDSACQNLNGGAKIDDKFSWKQCSANEPKLRDYTPEELYNFSQQWDIGFGALQKMTYPGSKTGETQVINVDGLNDEIPSSVLMKIKEFGNSTTPYWFDTNKNGTVPFILVHGSKVYKVELGPAQDAQHPRTWTTLNCTMGC